MLDIQPGQKIHVKVVKQPMAEAAGKTLRRVLNKDAAVMGVYGVRYRWCFRGKCLVHLGQHQLVDAFPATAEEKRHRSRSKP